MTGIQSYDAHEAQIRELCRKNTRANQILIDNRGFIPYNVIRNDMEALICQRLVVFKESSL